MELMEQLLELILKTKKLLVIFVIFQDMKCRKNKGKNFVRFLGPFQATIRLIVNQKTKLKLLLIPNIIMHLRLRKTIFISHVAKVL